MDSIGIVYVCTFGRSLVFIIFYFSFFFICGLFTELDKGEEEDTAKMQTVRLADLNVIRRANVR